MSDATLCVVNGSGALLQFIYIMIYFQHCESSTLRVSIRVALFNPLHIKHKIALDDFYLQCTMTMVIVKLMTFLLLNKAYVMNNRAYS